MAALPVTADVHAGVRVLAAGTRLVLVGVEEHAHGGVTGRDLLDRDLAALLERP